MFKLACASTPGAHINTLAFAFLLHAHIHAYIHYLHMRFPSYVLYANAHH